MNVQDFTYLLQHPDKVVSPLQTKQLEEVLEDYPYFQAARALQLKGLKNLNSFKYNNALKVTAAYTTDRDVLFFETVAYYTINRNWNFNASYRYVQRKFKSDVSDDRAPHSNRIYLGLTYNFPSLSTF